MGNWNISMISVGNDQYQFISKGKPSCINCTVQLHGQLGYIEYNIRTKMAVLFFDDLNTRIEITLNDSNMPTIRRLINAPSVGASQVIYALRRANRKAG